MSGLNVTEAAPEAQQALDAMETGGALLIRKHPGVSSFGLIEGLQDVLCRKLGVRRRDLPKMGHGGTLDPFATGLLIVCVGRGVKLARYFLGSGKVYEGRIRFGETTVPGDPTAPISERSEVFPASRDAIQEVATRLTQQPYLQTPPMHSAKKKNGKALYELAREGIEVEREPRLCHLYSFDILSYEKPFADFRLSCSSGTYVRTLAQDLARSMGTVALLETLHRVSSGSFSAENALSVEEFERELNETPCHQLPCWIPFDQLLRGYDDVQATQAEAEALVQGRQAVLPLIIERADRARPATTPGCIVIYGPSRELVAVARQDAGIWGIERVFVRD